MLWAVGTLTWGLLLPGAQSESVQSKMWSGIGGFVLGLIFLGVGLFVHFQDKRANPEASSTGKTPPLLVRNNGTHKIDEAVEWVGLDSLTGLCYSILGSHHIHSYELRSGKSLEPSVQSLQETSEVVSPEEDPAFAISHSEVSE
ncbi:hypothetical protein MJG53_017154 [Ovis ammon polii x Ovis aries]|uniref:Uncharacterized protein n=1 Tax=Ovis ammon polii x Ovis aries TaxID=2918886 RepID=A0ACB9U713_9CETA|nr:hypothetical protein MJG53_017154 [Ovis ammon polii x Ovis aries]